MRPRLIADKDEVLSPVKPRDGQPIPDVVDLKLSKSALDAAKEGMVRVVNNPPAGTGDAAQMAEFLVAGKTGTAQAQRIFDPVRDEQGQAIYLGEDGSIIKSDRHGYYVVTNDAGEVVRDWDGLPILRRGTPAMAERPLASADRETAWPWYRGWGQDGTEVSHAWFIGFAPADEPQVAFAVMIEHGGSGGLAASVAKDVLTKCWEHGYIKVKR